MMAKRVVVTKEEEARFALFLRNLREKGRSPRTLRAYEFDWSQFAAWYTEVNQEPFTLERLAAMDVQDYLTWGQQQNLKPATLNRRLAWLKQYATWGMEQKVVDPDMRRRIKAIPIQRKQQLAPRSLSPQEARKLLKEVKVRGNPRDEAIISLLLYTGLRVGELVSLTLADVTLSERKGVIQVRAEVAKGSKERAVPVPKQAREALQAYLAERPAESNGALFVGRQGALSVEGVAAIVAKYAAWSRLDEVTPHVLRHTFAYSYLENNNNDLVALADILGHSDLNTTRIYTRRRLSDLQEGAERVRFY
jgi:site-specific recombinase XerD